MDWSRIDDKRRKNAVNVKLISVDMQNKTAIVAGSNGAIYETTMESCTCGDFIRRRQPCKHMIRLAIEIGFLNNEGFTVEQEAENALVNLIDTVAYAYGCYYLLKRPVISDAEYDELKHILFDDYGYRP